MRRKDKEIGRRLRTLRKLHSVTQSQVAEFLCIDRSSYAYYELGRTLPSADKLAALSRCFGVSADFLLGLSIGEADLSNNRKPVYTKSPEPGKSSLESSVQKEKGRP